MRDKFLLPLTKLHHLNEIKCKKKIIYSQIFIIQIDFSTDNHLYLLYKSSKNTRDYIYIIQSSFKYFVIILANYSVQWSHNIFKQEQ